jgi:hypothetical protein
VVSYVGMTDITPYYSANTEIEPVGGAEFSPTTGHVRYVAGLAITNFFNPNTSHSSEETPSNAMAVTIEPTDPEIAARGLFNSLHRSSGTYRYTTDDSDTLTGYLVGKWRYTTILPPPRGLNVATKLTTEITMGAPMHHEDKATAKEHLIAARILAHADNTEPDRKKLRPILRSHVLGVLGEPKRFVPLYTYDTDSIAYQIRNNIADGLLVGRHDRKRINSSVTASLVRTGRESPATEVSIYNPQLLDASSKERRIQPQRAIAHQFYRLHMLIAQGTPDSPHA